MKPFRFALHTIFGTQYKDAYHAFLSLFIFFLFSSAGLPGQGYRIKISIPDLPDKEVILSHRFGLKFYSDDTVRTGPDGKAEFTGVNPLQGGMYQLVFPGKKFVEFFLDKDQNISVSTRASAPMDSLTFSGSLENSRFLEWQQQYGINRNHTGLIQSRLKKGNLSPDSTQLLNWEMKLLQESGNRLWDSAIEDLSGTLPGIFIKGMKPVKVPESLGKPDTPDVRVNQYQYVRAHFFDAVDFTDERLLRTPLIETKIDQYFKQILPQIPDTLNQEAKRIIDRSKPVKEMYQFVVQYLFNLFTDPQIMGTDAVYVYIAENYYLAGETHWIDSANLQGIRARVNELKPLLLGKVAPILEDLIDANDQPLEIKDIKSNYLILYFWSPDCGFCKESTPKLHAQYVELKQMGIEILAVNTRLDKDLWLKFIADNQLSWINVYSPKKVRDIVDKFQALSTPTLYILDSERRIIAKGISGEQVKPFLNQYQAGIKAPSNAR